MAGPVQLVDVAAIDARVAIASAGTGPTVAAMTTNNDTTNIPTDPAVTRWCSWHRAEHPVTEFGFTNKDAGTYQSKCRAGQREYSKANYAANREVRIAQVGARSEKIRAGLRDKLAAAVAERTCGTCGVSGHTERLEVHVADGHSPSQLISREATVEVLLATLDAPGTEIRCRPCNGRQFGEARRGTHTPDRNSTIAEAIAALLSESGPTRLLDVIDDISTSVGARVDYAVLMAVAAKEANRGAITRVIPGVYEAA